MVKEEKLSRSLSLVQATAINMIDMVGIGPFIVISTIVGLMGGAASMLAWVLGALLAFMDGMVWAELGAKWPGAGGSFIFLQKLFLGRGGRRMAFLFIWQTSIQAPLLVASAAIGFAQYFTYLIPLTNLQQRALSGATVAFMVVLLYRKISSIGRLSVVLWIITGATLIWIIIAGLPHFHIPQFATDLSKTKWMNLAFAAALGAASQNAVYSYLGYYNVCHLGAEIRNPVKNIPRAIFISVAGIAVLYLGMQLAVLSTLPAQSIANSKFVMSLYFEQLYGFVVAKVATGLILIIALASLFSVLLGYSRVPYAAAREGLFFPAFAKVHPRLQIPHISLLFLGGLGFVFALLFKMSQIISAIIIVRILVQFVSQAIGIIAWRRRAPADVRPYRMPLFPVPAVLSILIWLFIFLSAKWYFIFGALGIIAIGIVLFEVLPLQRIAPDESDNPVQDLDEAYSHQQSS